MILWEYAVAHTAGQALVLIEAGSPLCPETAALARLSIRASFRYAQTQKEASLEVVRLRAALDLLEGASSGKPGPKPACMCEPCKAHRAADLRWHNANKERRLKQNRERERRKRRLIVPGGVEIEYKPGPRELSDEELDQLALQKLHAEGFR